MGPLYGVQQKSTLRGATSIPLNTYHTIPKLTEKLTEQRLSAYQKCVTISPLTIVYRKYEDGIYRKWMITDNYLTSADMC